MHALFHVRHCVRKKTPLFIPFRRSGDIRRFPIVFEKVHMPSKFDPFVPMTVTDARRHIYDIVNFIVDNESRVFRIVSREGSVVVVNSHAWTSLKESVYVFADPVNSRFVHESIHAYLNGEQPVRMNPLTLSPDDDVFYGLID